MKKQAAEIRRTTGATRLVVRGPDPRGEGAARRQAAVPAVEREPMTIARFLRPAALLVLSLAIPAAAKDVYRAFLDPGIPQHKATLDILARLEETPNDASLHNDLGCLIARDGFWRDALREFETAEKLDKKDGRAPYNAGLVQTTRGAWGSARSAFKKAVDRDPGNWPAWWMLGFAEEKLGNSDSAVKAYAQSLRVDTSLFDVKKNPFALQSRLKARVLLETYDARFARAALPSTEQLAHPDVLTGFQSGRVGVTAQPGVLVPDEATRQPAAVARGPGRRPRRGGGGAGHGRSGRHVRASRQREPARASCRAARERAGGAAPGDRRRGGSPVVPADLARGSRAGQDAAPRGEPRPGQRARSRSDAGAHAGTGRGLSQPFHFGMKSVGDPAPPPAAGMNFRSSPTAVDPAQELREAPGEERLGDRVASPAPSRPSSPPRAGGSGPPRGPPGGARGARPRRSPARGRAGDRGAGRPRTDRRRSSSRRSPERLRERPAERVAGGLFREPLRRRDVREPRREPAALEDDRAPRAACPRRRASARAGPPGAPRVVDERQRRRGERVAPVARARREEARPRPRRRTRGRGAPTTARGDVRIEEQVPAARRRAGAPSAAGGRGRPRGARGARAGAPRGARPPRRRAPRCAPRPCAPRRSRRASPTRSRRRRRGRRSSRPAPCARRARSAASPRRTAPVARGRERAAECDEEPARRDLVRAGRRGERSGRGRSREPRGRTRAAPRAGAREEEPRFRRQAPPRRRPRTPRTTTRPARKRRSGETALGGHARVERALVLDELQGRTAALVDLARLRRRLPSRRAAARISSKRPSDGAHRRPGTAESPRRRIAGEAPPDGQRLAAPSRRARGRSRGRRLRPTRPRGCAAP